ncbi:glycosyltransferase [Methylobacillus arboreus]|uniref:glycosyltransferase family 2 protein n=1 Tax=Methylobacillus arboreus TaxID=755170 RepID=UPI001E52E7C8|nr:glycosyltransferase family 2 protein [Methylobacillus arboreus]MCB5189967.1 glycosyltransferase [Methylobacillus arboreus]
MKISIVTVCYNSAATISDTIASVKSQQYRDREHIIIDGASTDGTLELVKSATSVSQYISEPDQGIYDAMNKGLRRVTGDVVGFLNADDFYADETVLGQVAEVFKDPTVQACYADLLYIDQDDTSRVVRYWKSRSFEPGLFKRGWMPAHPTFFVRKSIYEKFGFFDTNYKIAADFELMMRFLEINRIKVAYLPKIFVRMRIGGETNRSFINIINQNKEIVRILKKYSFKMSVIELLARKVVTRGVQFLARGLV